MTALPCDDLVALVIKAASPVLFLDTCIILDIVRAPILKKMRVHEIKAVHTVIARATQDIPKVSLIISEQVKREFLDNIDKVEEETHKEIQETQDRVIEILERMDALSPINHISSANEISLGSPAKGRQLAEQIVQISTILEADNDDSAKAVNRVISVEPPATKGNQSVKDCLIIENYLRLARALCGSDFSQNMVFATSNNRDYQQGSRLHPNLRKEFELIDLEYSPNWSAVRYELDRYRTM